jgi:hypothetical protein
MRSDLLSLRAVATGEGSVGAVAALAALVQELLPAASAD